MGVSAAEAPDFIHCVGEASRVAFEFSPDPSPPLQNMGVPRSGSVRRTKWMGRRRHCVGGSVSGLWSGKSRG